MNILWFNHRDPLHPHAGGAEVRILELGKRLVNNGFNIKLVCERWNGSECREFLDGIEIFRVSNMYGIHFMVPFLLTKFYDYYDIVIDDIAHAVPWFSSFFTNKPVIGQVHHVHQRSLASELSPLLAKFVALSEAQIKYAYKKLIVVSESTKKDLINTLGVSEEKITVVPNGVSLEHFRSNKKSCEPRVLWVGRIKQYKRVNHVLQAFRKVSKVFPNAELFIVGDGCQLGAVKKQSKDLGLSNVIFTGRISDEEKIQLMSSSWVIVNTSLIEGWGLVLTECGSCGTTAVAYDVSGLRDSVQDGVTGLLVENGNISALAEKIIEVLKNEPLRYKLNENSLRYAKKFNWDTTTEQFMNTMERVVIGK